MLIDGSAALVAGGASGLGEATARRLHAAGAAVVIADQDEDRGGALAAELGERASFQHADVTDPASVQIAVNTAAAQPGGLRISVCCAGIVWAERVAGKRGAHGLEPFQIVIAVNLIGTFNVLRLAAAAMLENHPAESGERGVCINTASIAAFDGQIGQAAYSASKGAIASMTLPAARDLASAGIRVCTIAPGTFDTPLLSALPEEAREALGAAIPFPSRLGRPDEFGGLLVFEAQPPLTRAMVAERIGERIHLIARLRQRLEEPPLGLANPVWTDDLGFGLDWHMRQASLPAPGGEAELGAFVGREFSHRLDRSRPLWEATVATSPAAATDSRGSRMSCK
jgi:3-hydroxyacyl-CoA dehydrogenase/3-hydroxy-2-methylbutyryl-CoA dehydrogenase